MKALLVALLAFCAAIAPAFGQAANKLPSTFGVDYTFERMYAKVKVNDRFDRRTIKLVAYVYRPLKNDNGGVIVFPHGSTGGQAIAPGEPFIPPRTTIDFVLAHGYTFVAPYRRGFNESEGTFIEECAFQAGKCTLAENRELVLASLDEALASTAAVVDQIVLAKLHPRGGKIILWGGSRGGYLSIMYAAAHPAQVRGVIALSPGAISVVDKWPEDENALRIAYQKAQFEKAGVAYHGPTLWVYAARDPFYDPDELGRDFFDAFQKGGGRGTFVFLSDHKLPSGHVPPIELWSEPADTFLKEIEGVSLSPP